VKTNFRLEYILAAICAVSSVCLLANQQTVVSHFFSDVCHHNAGQSILPLAGLGTPESLEVHSML
jgi:hypothetical protein